MSNGNGADYADGLLFVSAGSGLYAYITGHLGQIAAPKYQWISEIQPILTASASIVAVIAGCMSFYYHYKKTKNVK